MTSVSESGQEPSATASAAMPSVGSDRTPDVRGSDPAQVLEKTPSGDETWSADQHDAVFVGEEVLRRQAIAQRRAKIRVVTSLVVLLAGGWLLQAMYGDTRYFLSQSDENPIEVPSLADYLEGGGTVAQLDGLHVDLRATPDVRSVAKLVSKGKDDAMTEVGYVRLVEAGLDLVAATPKVPGGVSREYPGRFIGRVRRLQELPVYPWARDYYAGQQIRQSHDLVAVVAMSPGNTWTSTNHQTFSRSAEDRLEVVIKMPHLLVQLGKASWPTREQARARLDELGLIYAQLPEVEIGSNAKVNPGQLPITSHYFAFVVEPPQNGIDLAQVLNQALQVKQDAKDEIEKVEAIEKGAGIVANAEEAIAKDKANPSSSGRLEVGATVLPLIRTYWVRPEKLTLRDANRVRLEPESKVVGPGWERKDGQLIERSWQDEGVEFELSQVQHVRLSRLLQVHSDTRVIQVGAKPSGQWQSAGLFAFLLLIVGANTVSLVRGLKALASAQHIPR